jgi:hypothetical protein
MSVLTFGIERTMSCTRTRPRSLSSSPLIWLREIGTSWAFSARFRALTTTSSSASSAEPGAGTVEPATAISKARESQFMDARPYQNGARCAARTINKSEDGARCRGRTDPWSKNGHDEADPSLAKFPGSAFLA